MRPTWVPSGADRIQVGPMLTSWTLLSGIPYSLKENNSTVMLFSQTLIERESDPYESHCSTSDDHDLFYEGVYTVEVRNIGFGKVQNTSYACILYIYNLQSGADCLMCLRKPRLWKWRGVTLFHNNCQLGLSNTAIYDFLCCVWFSYPTNRFVVTFGGYIAVCMVFVIITTVIHCPDVHVCHATFTAM